MPLKIQVIPGDALDGPLCERWRTIQQADPRLASPYLCPEFTQAVAAVRDDVYVGVLEEGGEAVGFFPFQRGSGFWRTGGPVGGRLSDCQAVIVQPGVVWSAAELVRGCGLKLWDFDHLLAHQSEFEAGVTARDESPILDLSHGFEAYVAQRKASGSKKVDQVLRLFRKLAREHEGVRFEPVSNDAAALRQVIDWKIEQCVRTGTPVFFRERWTVELVERIFATSEPDFAGALTVLYVGDEVAAAHFGMRSSRVWHWWFPTYSEVYSSYSPGTQLLVKLAEHVGSLEEQDRSPHVIDLGKGDDAYKRSFASGAIPLAEGSVSCGSVYGSVRAAKRAALSGLRASPVGGLARGVKQRLRGEG